MFLNKQGLKFWGLSLMIISIGCLVLAQSTGTGTGGSAQNSSMPGSGGSSGNITTNSANVFTGTNTFTGDTTANNLQVNGRLLVNGVQTNAGSVISTINSTNTFYAPIITSNITVNGSSTLGSSASSTITINGTAITIPNGINLGSGVQIYPSSTSGNTTNGSAVFVIINTLQASNIVAQTVDGTSYFNTGTNQLLRIIANSSASPIQTEGIYTSRTNTLEGTVGAMNVIYTNNALRGWVSMGVALPATATTISSAGFWTITAGGITNISGIVASDAGLAGESVTNSVSGFVDPLQLYMWTNLITTAGAPTAVPAYHVQKRF